MTTYTVTATATNATTNQVTVNSAANMFSGLPIQFSGTTFGGITAGATYYIGTVVPGYPTSTITVTSLPGGAVFVLTTATGSMTGTFTQGGQQIIDTGAVANDGTGAPLRTAFTDTNTNFDQIFAAGPVGSNIQIANNTIYTTNTNGNLILNPNGVGSVVANAHVIPDLYGVRNLGSSAKKWNTVYSVYLDTSYATIGTANIGNIGTLNVDIANLHISGGTNGYVLQTDGTGNLTWTAQTGGAGNGTPAGANTQIQYNNAGNFGAAAGFTFNSTKNLLNIANVAAGNVNAGLLFTGNTIPSVIPDIVGLVVNNGDTPTAWIGRYDPANVASHGYLQLAALPQGNGASITTDSSYFNITNAGNAGIINLSAGYLGSKTWVFDSNGQLTTPGEFWVQSGDGYNSIVFTPNGTNNNGQIKVDGGQNMVVSAGSNFYVKRAGQDRIAVTDTTSDLMASTNVRIQSNKAGTANTWTFDTTGNLTLPSNSANVNYANGVSILDGVASNYGDANVVSLLADFGSNTVSTTGTVTAGSFTTSGASGNITGANYVTANYFVGDGGLLSNVGALIQSDTAPVDPTSSTMWWDTVSGALYVWYTDISGSQWVAASPTGVNFANVASNIIPSANNVFSLGNATNQWASVYVGANTLYLDNVPVGINGNVLTVDGANVITANATGTLDAADISVTGNITANGLYAGNIAGGTGYFSSNADGTSFGIVAAGGMQIDTGGIYITSTGGVNIYGVAGAQVVLGGGTSGNIVVSSDVNSANTISAGYFVGDGSQLTGITVSGTGPVSTTGNVSGGNLIATGTVSATGNITSGNLNTGVITLTNGAVIKDTAGDAIAIGQGAGEYPAQGAAAVAVGKNAGNYLQGINAVAIGNGTGGYTQGNSAVSVGWNAGNYLQGANAVAIGNSAGYGYQGQYAVAIGTLAGADHQANNSIIINATAANLDQTTANTFTVAPIRNDVANTGQVLFYNTTSKEITYGNIISVAGNITGGNVTAGSLFYTTGNVVAIGAVNTPNVVITKSFLFDGLYGNATIDNRANISTTGNITAGYVLGNAAFMTGIPASYGNSNVTTLLASFGSNTISTTGNITSGNVALTGNLTVNGAPIYGVPASYAKYTRTTQQTGSIVSNTVVVCNVSENTFGSDISVNTTTGQVTLQAGRTYRLRGSVPGWTTSGSNGTLQWCWYNETTPGWLGESGENYPGSSGASYGAAGGSAEAVFTPNVTTVVSFRILSANNISALGGNNDFSTTGSYPWIDVQVIGGQAPISGYSTAGNVIAANFIGNISITGNVTGTSPNVQLVAGSYTWTFDNTGNLTLPTNGDISMPGNNAQMTVGGTINSYGNTNGTAFAVIGNGAYSNVALGYFPTAGTGANMAIRDYSTANSYMYFDATAGSANTGGAFVFRSSNAYTTLALINTYGVVQPTKPAFRVYGNGVTNGLNVTTNTNGVLNGNNWAVDYNQGSYLNSTTGTFTAPVAGLYQVNLVARVANNVAPQAQAVVVKNYGTANVNQVMWEVAANCTTNHFGVSTVSKLAVGDTLTLRVALGNINFDVNDNWSVAFLG
jgi:hypothetical protein